MVAIGECFFAMPTGWVSATALIDLRGAPLNGKSGILVQHWSLRDL